VPLGAQVGDHVRAALLVRLDDEDPCHASIIGRRVPGLRARWPGAARWLD
jgi:hypothetical protein